MPSPAASLPKGPHWKLIVLIHSLFYETGMKDRLFVCFCCFFLKYVLILTWAFAIGRLPRRIKAAAVRLMLGPSGLEHMGSAGFSGFINSADI